MQWYYSKTAKLYVCLEPLKISVQAFAAAKELGIKLQWDDNGFIINLTLFEARMMAQKLDAAILSPSEYWTVHKDAENDGRNDVISSLESEEYTEFLDRVYIAENEYIDHPAFEYIKGQEKTNIPEIKGQVINCSILAGRPGWIYRNEIDLSTGHPLKVHEKVKDSGLLKYWSPDLNASRQHLCFPIRGYVTSVAAISLDLGIPIESYQPKLMLRLCRATEPDAEEDGDSAIKKEEEIIQRGRDSINSLKEYKGQGRQFALEDYIDSKIQGRQLSLQDFTDYICRGREILKMALAEEKDIVLVMGHRNPDSDTVISSLFESFRQHLLNEDENRVYLPLIQSQGMPLEIKTILGDEISKNCLFENELPIDSIMDSGRLKVIFTDQNYQKEYQKYLIGVTDHHEKSSKISANAIRIPSHIEKAGSATSFIAAKYIGSGFVLDQPLAKMLYSAMLMDTENRVEHKMTDWDKSVMDLFKALSATENDGALYNYLMDKLLRETDIKLLFRRDYKSYAGYGFAVIKTCGFEARASYSEDIEKLLNLAQEENKKNHFLFTLLKLVDYNEKSGEVEKEQLIPVFRKDALPEKKEAVMKLLREEILFVFPKANICIKSGITDGIKDGISDANNNGINSERNIDNNSGINCEIMEVTGIGKQISRKAIAPLMEQLVGILEAYCYIPELGKYVSRDFARPSDFKKFDQTKYQLDKKGRICEISFNEAKELLAENELEILSLKEYWQVLDYARKEQDTELINSMMSADFLEYLDTISDRGRIIHHPVKSGADYSGDGKEENIIPARPGLILVEEMSKTSGLPMKVHSPAEFENKDMWRYWSPENDGTYVFSRSYIFLIGQRCLDAKMSSEESCANLGIRLVKRDISIPKVDTFVEDGKLKIIKQ